MNPAEAWRGPGSHVLRLADDSGYRHQIKAQANLTEGRHALGRKIFYGDAGSCASVTRTGWRISSAWS